MRARTSGLALLAVLSLAIIAMLSGLAAQDEDGLKDSRSPSEMSGAPWHRQKHGREGARSRAQGLNLDMPLGSP